MAKQVIKKNIRKQKKIVSPFNIYWKKKNFILLFMGLLVIIIGFVFMSMGTWDSFSALVISPIILVTGYLIILPASILWHGKEEPVDKDGQEVATGKS
jgi:membrane protein YdbS with pleckstrin-like domain